MILPERPSQALKNHLLAALPEDVFARLQPNLKLVSFKLGDVLYEAGEQMQNLYFPTTAIISLLYIMENGATAEIGMTGNDGLVGISLFMGGGATSSRAVIQSAGEAYRLNAEVLHTEFRRGGTFQQLLLRYTQALMTQISQTAVCNRLHTVEQQLCRWLLINNDLLPTDELVMTHDLIANMLGVRREGVTLAAGRLQEEGLISYSRGTIKMTDRKGLENRVCECYQVVKNEYARLLGKYISKNKKPPLNADAASSVTVKLSRE